MSSPKPFKSVTANRPGRSVFNLSYEKKFTCDMGELIPVMCDELVPGDKFDIGNQIVIRLQPLVAPVLHEIYVYAHYFFVPYRVLWDDWEEFISGGKEGDSAAVMPTWEPTDTTIGSLWDYLGFPTGVDPDGAYPIDMPRRAYNMVWNEYYRDENLQDEIALTNEDILLRAWEKDYFTSALPWQQRGDAPAIPITGTTNAQFSDDIGLKWPGVSSGSISSIKADISNNRPGDALTKNAFEEGYVDDSDLNTNVVDFSDASTFDVADLRLAFQIQKWMERNARSGVRYTEFLTAHFGVSPRDDRLQRPEYIGGSKQPVIVSEVLQTSSTDAESPQGNLAGHGISVSGEHISKFTAPEFGLIIGIMSVMPKPAYQQGIDRQWRRDSRYDFYFPEFANLSEQAIMQSEIYATGTESENNTVFGYQGRYDEMRIKRNMVASGMRDTFDYWHLGRQFGSAPLLNESFIQCVPRKDIFAVQDEDGLIVNVNNAITAVRPLPIVSNPGLIDHD